jgi:hypothetical protein
MQNTQLRCLTELGYPSTEADARDRLVRSLRSATSYCLVAEVAAEVVGLISAELVFYFSRAQRFAGSQV